MEKHSGQRQLLSQSETEYFGQNGVNKKRSGIDFSRKGVVRYEGIVTQLGGSILLTRT